MGSILNINNEDGKTVCSFPVVNMQAEMSSKEPAVYTITISNNEVAKIYNNFLDEYDSILDNDIRTNKYKINMLELNIEKDRLKKNNIKEIKEALNNIYNINKDYLI